MSSIAPSMRGGTETVWVDRAVDQMTPSIYAYAVVALCGLIGAAEGYDAQAMAFAAPLVARAWQLSSGQLGALLASSIIAMVAGNFLLAPLGDRWGRRPAILAALAVAACATAAGAFAPDFRWMLVWRVGAGLGLGLAFPTVITLAMEVMPRRLYAMAVVFVGCGYPIGGAIGGAGAAALIDAHGHPAVFLVGGCSTAVLFLLCLPLLPESPLWLGRRAPRDPSLPRLLRRLGAIVPSSTAAFGIGESPVHRSAVAELFTKERWARTILLWVINFANLSLVYFYVMWLPTILVNAGHGAAFAVKALALYSAAGVVGGLLLALVLRRGGAGLTIGGAYAGIIVLLPALAGMSVFAPGFLVVLAASGALIVGSQFCLSAVVTRYYPSSIRATASGYASGMGRLGAVAAPLVGTFVVSSTRPSWLPLAIGVVPAAIALVALLVLVFAAPLQAPARLEAAE